LASHVAETAAAAEKAEGAVAHAEQTLKDVEAEVAGLPARAPLETALEAHKQRAKLDKDVLAAGKAVAKLEKEQGKFSKAAAAAEKAADEAQHVLEAARVQHRAHDLARALVAGEPCPVCGQDVHTLPAVDVPMDLKTAEKHASAALAAHKKAGEDLVRVERDVALAARDVESMTKQAKMLDEVLSTHPGLETIQQQLATVLAAEKKLESARRDADAARATARKARVAADAATKTETVARKTLDGARDGVAEFAPPPLSRDDLASDWIAMTDWARAEATRRRAAATEALQAAREAKHAQDALIESQRAACVEAGIEDVTNPRDDCLKALERAKERVTSIELALETAKEIAEMVRGLDEQGVVARELGKHLKANAFERWVLRQALTTLVDGATTILLELSAGQYSLTLDKQFNFAVIDHRNANATRSARTLSGGETFLASLALALAMSDRIAQLSANTAVRLESIFLDEGFGSLDPETLETVATAIEQLGRTSRVVGIVTHVRDLADRIPVRYEVRKGPTTSTVEKVLA
jgi:exonuclease SbcC